MRQKKPYARQLAIFKGHGGILRTSQAMRLGIHPRDLYAMTASAVLEQIHRGVYRISAAAALVHPDLVTVVIKVPKGVICLISALAIHEITTQIPHEVYIALPYGAEKPRLKHPPARYVWFKEPAFSSGIERKQVDGLPLRIYSAGKTVADCFKARNKIGLDVAIEALKLCREKRRSSADELLKFARVCRVEKIMRPYLEAIF